jgi:hypothetical protein
MLRRVALPTLAAVVATACCNNEPPATIPIARVFLNATMGPGANPQSVCKPVAGPWLQIGTPTHSVEDGDVQGNAMVSVTCTVSAEGGGYQVQATTTLSGATGGTFTVTGQVVGSGTESGLRGAFTRADTGTFIETDCTATYSDPSGASLDKGGVAPGRVRVFLSCPSATKAGEFVPNPDGGTQIPRTCDGEAELKFENCSQ